LTNAPKLVDCAAYVLGRLGQEVPGARFTEIFKRHAPIVLAHASAPQPWRPEQGAAAARAAAEALIEATEEGARCKWTSASVKARREFDRLWFFYGTVCFLLERIAREKLALLPLVLKLQWNGARVELRPRCSSPP
jgi:hypothetical protein